MNIVDRITIAVSRAAMLLILLGVAITFYEIVMRHLFNSPTTWVYKKTLWLGAIVYLISGAYTMQQRRHIRISALYDIAPDWLKTVLDYISLFVIVVFTTLMITGGAGPAYAAFSQWIESGGYFDPSIAGTIKPLVLITTTVVAIVAINNLISNTHNTREKLISDQTNRKDV